ncbi:hypothetical protein [Amycolatopsis taiwanensis]|uniref:hypothetical protein n=1 Tax=Amycolatopsis taiwanensis TaxID=342230 RepID=UPI0004BAA4E7|nr:hypothetical protein [Amycolatopsis taiwanensis]
MGRHSMVEEPAPRPSDGRTSTGHHQTVESTGRQRAIESTGRQRAIESTDRQRAIESTGRQRAVESTGRQRAIESTGRQRAIESTGRQRAVESTGYHRAVGKSASRRRIAKWPLVAATMIVLVTVGVFAWNWANDVVDNRAEAQAKSCAEGDSTMRVLVAPGAARSVSAAAAKWNNARTVVHSHCVRIDVQTVPSDRAFDALTGRTGLDTIGGLPAAWVPEAADDWGGRLATARPDLVATPAEPLTAGYAYVCLGGPDLDEVAVRAAQVFRDFLLDPAQQAGVTDAG